MQYPIQAYEAAAMGFEGLITLFYDGLTSLDGQLIADADTPLERRYSRLHALQALQIRVDEQVELAALRSRSGNSARRPKNRREPDADYS